jgi:hypothetical protein
MNDFSIKKNKRVLKEIKKNVKKGKKKSWSAHAKFDFFGPGWHDLALK